MEKKISHLEIIQGVVNRLSQNSFLLKGWSVILVSALFALAASNTRISFICLAYFPVLAFWILDGYFLWQESLYRKLYDYVRNLEEEEIDFSMDTSIVKNKVETWRNVVFSKTLAIFHGTLFCSIFIVMLIMIFLCKGGT